MTAYARRHLLRSWRSQCRCGGYRYCCHYRCSDCRPVSLATADLDRIGLGLRPALWRVSRALRVCPRRVLVHGVGAWAWVCGSVAGVFVVVAWSCLWWCAGGLALRTKRAFPLCCGCGVMVLLCARSLTAQCRPLMLADYTGAAWLLALLTAPLTALARPSLVRWLCPVALWFFFLRFVHDTPDHV